MWKTGLCLERTHDTLALRGGRYEARLSRIEAVAAPTVVPDHYLVIERSKHGPRVLGVFTTRNDAEVARDVLLAARPKWKKLVSIRGKAPKQRRANGK